jgi:hypothetical protein
MSDTRDEGEVIFFYSALRSGSTMLRLMLDAHPEIACPGERDFMLDALHPGPDGGLVLDAEELETSRIFHAAGLPVPQARGGVDAFQELLASDRAKTGKPVHVIVLHRRLDRLLQVMPRARFIHLLRDPRDVARSVVGRGWAGSTWYGVDQWLATEEDWIAQAPDDPRRVCTMRYEDLLEQPEAELRRLCDFIGRDYTDAMLSYAGQSTYEPIDPKLAYQWRRKQSPAEVSDTEWKAAALMKRYGYDFSPAGARAPGPLRRLWLAAQNKAVVWRQRIQRYGLIDPLIVAWGYKGGPRGLARAARRRMNAKAVKYLK